MMEWTDVDPARFETYPSPRRLKGPDAIDAVIEAVAAGKTVELTLVDESAVRGRRLALGGRAKRLGLEIRMRYQGNKIVVQQKTGVADEPAAPEPDAPPPSTPVRGSRRTRS